MDYRKNNFTEKFTLASKTLDTEFDNIISIKFRENVQDYNVYTRLLEKLVILSKAKIEPLKGDYQGRAHLVKHFNEKVIIVEHESGLEILYIAGSIASFLGLIPLIIQIWKATHNRRIKDDRPHDRFYRDEILQTEIRQFDKKGNLIEEKETDILGKNPYIGRELFSNDVFQRFMEIISNQGARITYLEEWIKVIEKKLTK